MNWDRKVVRVVRFVGVPDSKVAQLLKDLGDELAGRDTKFVIWRGTVELWIYQ